MEMKGMMGGLYRICEWIMRFSVINILWVLCSIPIFYFLIVLLHSQTLDQFVFTLMIMGVLSPFTLFPATSAMFAVARKWVMGEEDVPLFKTFFRSYKENYVKSMFGGIIFTFLIVLMIVNYRFYAAQESALQFLSVVFIAFLLVVFISMFHFFSIVVHLEMKTLQVVKNAILITLGRPLTSVLITITNLFILYISFYHFTFLIPFFMGSLIAYMTFFHFHRLFLKIKKKQEEYEAELGESEEKKNGENVVATSKD
jgi:uncharacterized membrane protein YesL